MTHFCTILLNCGAHVAENVGTENSKRMPAVEKCVAMAGTTVVIVTLTSALAVQL
jgi:hypothetical protein